MNKYLVPFSSQCSYWLSLTVSLSHSHLTIYTTALLVNFTSRFHNVSRFRIVTKLTTLITLICWSWWPRSLRRRSTAVCLLGLWVRILLGHGCLCCVLSGRGLCDGLITRPEEKSYRLWCIIVCDLETSRMRRPLPAAQEGGRGGRKKRTSYINSWLLVMAKTIRNHWNNSCHIV